MFAYCNLLNPSPILIESIFRLSNRSMLKHTYVVSTIITLRTNKNLPNSLANLRNLLPISIYQKEPTYNFRRRAFKWDETLKMSLIIGICRGKWQKTFFACSASSFCFLLRFGDVISPVSCTSITSSRSAALFHRSPSPLVFFCFFFLFLSCSILPSPALFCSLLYVFLCLARSVAGADSSNLFDFLYLSLTFRLC